MANDGDGAIDADATVLQLGHMLASPGFAEAVQAIPKPGQEQQTIGDYFQQG